MKVGYLPSRVHLECDTHAADAEQPHALVHVVIPSRTDRISQSLLVASEWSRLGLKGGLSTIGNVSLNNSLPGFGLVSLSGSSGAGIGNSGYHRLL